MGLTSSILCICVGISFVDEWREDLKNLLRKAGGEGKQMAFLLSDAQITDESFLEDVNNLLNTGEVPNLYTFEEQGAVVEMVRVPAQQAGKVH